MLLSIQRGIWRPPVLPGGTQHKAECWSAQKGLVLSTQHRASIWLACCAEHQHRASIWLACCAQRSAQGQHLTPKPPALSGRYPKAVVSRLPKNPAALYPDWVTLSRARL